tara:strand:+ start:488 stop:997 length:510 start_codon:yes stop_codon:yes gene_type:complete
MKKKNKNKGVLIWITGLSGAGKTSLANQIKKKIKENYGPTLLINGDDLRKIFKLNKYDKSSRLKYVKQYSELVRFITNQGINVIFTVVGLFDSIRNWNRKNINNYIEIFVKADILQIKKKRKKKIYFKKKQIMGVQIKPEFPKKPDIILINDFKSNIKKLSKVLIKKII